MVLYIFFFKQKTSYEMRSSDWSSDVCSSDLEEGGIRALLMGLTRYGWEPVLEGGNVIALSGSDGTISLEPAGQLELSGAPLDNLHETCAETGRPLEQVKNVGDTLGLGFLEIGRASCRDRVCKYV